jgi:alginate O-acetyltransferase complex protein AlgI
MVFSTHLFLFYFLPLILLLNYSLPFRTLSLMLTLVSYAFYGWTNPVWVLLMLFSSYIDYLCGLTLVRQVPGGGATPVGGEGRKLLPWLLALGSIGFLGGQFTYCGFAGVDWFANGLAALPLLSGAAGAGAVCVAAWYAGTTIVRTGDLPRLERGAKRTRRQKIALITSMVSNLSLLGFFKYWDFGMGAIADVAAALGMQPSELMFLHVALPVGISFYTFQSMSYAIDVYRGDARPLKSPIDFMCFVALYPQLIAGPIIRYETVAEQMRRREHRWDLFARGTALFCLGMAKKILLANPMGHIADNAFLASASGLHWYDAWFGIMGYAFQLYFDFAAYSDMAVGLGLMHGFKFMKNFDSPYLAESVTDFWRRWHISLSTWLRDYLYIPLGGNRLGEFRTYANLMIVMLLGGLWHGAGWTFIIWGAIHGGMLAFERMQGRDSPYRKLPRAVRVGITFAIACLAWVYFRADTLELGNRYIASLFGMGDGGDGSDLFAGAVYTPYHLGMFAIACTVVWLSPQAWTFSQRLTPARAAWCMAVFALAVLFMWTQDVNPFLYFQF